MACRLFGAKPLSEPMLPYCQLDHREHFNEISFKIQKFSFKNMRLKMLSAKWQLLCLSLSVLIFIHILISFQLCWWKDPYQPKEGFRHNMDGSVQDSSNSSALAMELLQSCTKPLIYMNYKNGISYDDGEF